MNAWTVYYPGYGVPQVREVRWEGQGHVVLCEPDYMAESYHRRPLLAPEKHAFGRYETLREAGDARQVAYMPSLRVQSLMDDLRAAQQQEAAETRKRLSASE